MVDEKKNFGFAMIAIVAIVAIVGVVMIFAMNGKATPELQSAMQTTITPEPMTPTEVASVTKAEGNLAGMVQFSGDCFGYQYWTLRNCNWFCGEFYSGTYAFYNPTRLYGCCCGQLGP